MALLQLFIYGLMQLDLKKEHIILRTVLATLNHGQAPPSFVGNDYYCESGSPNHPTGSSFTWFTGDPLWDGAGCGGQESPCCNRAGLPWFKKSLSIPTTASISVRVCRDTSSNEKYWYSTS